MKKIELGKIIEKECYYLNTVGNLKLYYDNLGERLISVPKKINEYRETFPTMEGCNGGCSLEEANTYVEFMQSAHKDITKMLKMAGLAAASLVTYLIVGEISKDPMVSKLAGISALSLVGGNLILHLKDLPRIIKEGIEAEKFKKNYHFLYNATENTPSATEVLEERFNSN